MEKIASLTFQKIQHLITAVDCQPMFDGGILINVLGQLKVCVLFGNGRGGSGQLAGADLHIFQGGAKSLLHPNFSQNTYDNGVRSAPKFFCPSLENFCPP